MVEPDRGAEAPRDAAPHPEQAEVVVVVGLGGTQERGGRALVDDRETQHLGVEVDAAGHVAHVEHGVVEPADAHWVNPPVAVAVGS